MLLLLVSEGADGGEEGGEGAYQDEDEAADTEGVFEADGICNETCCHEGDHCGNHYEAVVNREDSAQNGAVEGGLEQYGEGAEENCAGDAAEGCEYDEHVEAGGGQEARSCVREPDDYVH